MARREIDPELFLGALKEVSEKYCLPSPIPTKREPHLCVIALADDWEGFYVNNVLVRQAHRIRVYDVLEVMEQMGLIKFAQYEDYVLMDEDDSNAPQFLPEKYREI